MSSVFPMLQTFSAITILPQKEESASISDLGFALAIQYSFLPSKFKLKLLSGLPQLRVWIQLQSIMFRE
jgi:hypothetical protein